MAPEERNERFLVRMTEKELEMLRWVADEQGLTASDVVRQLIRLEYDERRRKKMAQDQIDRELNKRKR
jgi:hypothetical protein